MNEIIKSNGTGLSLQPREITLNQVQIAQNMGNLAYKSGIFKAPTPEASAMIMLKGYELGFPMTASAEFIQIIEGTVGLTPRGALAIMRSRPDVIASVTTEDLYQDGKYFGCKCTIVRIENGSTQTYTEQFTLEDAKQADLIRAKSGWEKYPRKMCQWRALGFCADLACPDLLAGMTGIMKMPEIMTDDQIVSFDNGAEQEPKVEVIEPEPENAKEWNLSSLIAQYGAEKILAANNNMMPRSNAECAKIAEMLEGSK